MRRIALIGALAFACAANADTTLEYTVLHSGTQSGAQTTTIDAGGTVRVSYSHRENGRGPDLEEEFTPAADGAHRYLILDPAQKDKIIRTFVETVSAKPQPRQFRFRRPVEEQKQDQKQEQKQTLPPKP